jgi:phosphoserine aminotransferase
MKSERIWNFSSGPTCIPLPVLKKAQADLLNYNGTGISVAELSHRSKSFKEIWNNVRDGFRKYLSIPETHKVMLIPDDASMQFAAVPMNFLAGKSVANYLVTGYWSEACIQDAEAYCKINRVSPDPPKSICSIISPEKWHIDPKGAYLHYCSNETGDGITLYDFPYEVLPEKMPLICDMSSELGSRQIDISKFGVIYAGVQKNFGSSGVTVLIIRKELLDKSTVLPITPSVFNYPLIQEAPDEMYNTPATWSCYITGLCLEYMNEQGIKYYENLSIERSKLLYDFIDNSQEYYTSRVDPKCRSRNNVIFHLSKGEEVTKKFIEESELAGFSGLQGFKTIGGVRASIYNAMPIEGVHKLIEFMKKFMNENK